ncbi:reverse transcriptase domain-containing protein [Tanacetum coccineum]
MRTRSSLEYTIPRRRNCRRSRHRQEAIPLNLDPIPMADNRTMAQMLQAPIEGYEDAIVVPPINANNFELKQPLINLVQSNKFTGRQDPHNHLRFFNKVTSTFRHPEVPNTSVKLLLFPFSLDGEARDWLDKEPPRSILTWDDLVSKFINQYFPPSKTTYYRNEIITFYQKPNGRQESFILKAWERMKVYDFRERVKQQGIFETQMEEQEWRIARVRIEKTKRSKNDQKPTRNGKKDKESRARVRNQPKITAGSARHSQTQKLRESKVKNKVKGPKLSSVQRLEAYVEFQRFKGQSCQEKKM